MPISCVSDLIPDLAEPARVHRSQELLFTYWVSRGRANHCVHSAMRTKRCPASFAYPFLNFGSHAGSTAVEAAANLALF
jgi:hypothetical protein